MQCGKQGGGGAHEMKKRGEVANLTAAENSNYSIVHCEFDSIWAFIFIFSLEWVEDVEREGKFYPRGLFGKPKYRRGIRLNFSTNFSAVG